MNRVPEYMQRGVEVKAECPELMPERAYPSDAGADLRSNSNQCIYPGEVKMIDTGVAIKIPVGYVGLVFPRSSQGKLRINLANSTGVIDADYRGNIKVILVNDGENPYKIEARATKIAQLVIVPCMLAKFVPFENTWYDTARSTGGFGSTGT